MNVPDVDLLNAALATVGLARRGGVLRDSNLNKYACFAEDGIEPSPGAPGSVEGFLRVSYFEHYSFPGDYKVIHNPFYGMSREELELKLAVIGK